MYVVENFLEKIELTRTNQTYQESAGKSSGPFGDRDDPVL